MLKQSKAEDGNRKDFLDAGVDDLSG